MKLFDKIHIDMTQAMEGHNLYKTKLEVNQFFCFPQQYYE